MYLKQARTYTPKDISFKERNLQKTKYPLEKYLGILAKRICYFCGKNDHFQDDCEKKKKMVVESIRITVRHLKRDSNKCPGRNPEDIILT